MKFFTICSISFIGIIVLLFFVIGYVFGLDYDHEFYYQTRQDAVEDSLFDKGWLPDIIPPSSHGIITINNYDLNTSSGEFYFTQGDTAFIDRLIKLNPVKKSYYNSNKYKERNYLPYSFTNNGYSWSFFINKDKGHCEYILHYKSNQ